MLSQTYYVTKHTHSKQPQTSPQALKEYNIPKVMKKTVETNRNRILILANAGEANNIELASKIANLGWKVILVSHQLPAKPIPANIRFQRIHLPIAYPLSYLAFFEFALIILRYKPTIIHAFHLSDYGVLAGLSQRFLLSRRVLVSATGEDINKDAFTLRGWSIKHILVLVEEVTCIDEAAKDAAIQLGTPKQRINLVSESVSSCMEFDTIYRKMLEKP